MSLEKEYISIASLEHRKKFSQFYTNQQVAHFMIKWLMESNPSSIYDPAFGMGIFHEVALSVGFKGEFFGNEVDKQSFDFFNSKVKSTSLSLKNEDYFLNWNNHNKYEAIICNPPYRRFQHFNNRDEIFKNLSLIFKTKISGYTNIASAFLLKSIYELKENGRLAYIMPLEFLSTGYGKIIKKILLNYGSIKEIFYIKDENGVFDNVITTVCVIFFEKNQNHKSIKFSQISKISDLQIESINIIDNKSIDPKDKWLLFFEKNPINIPKNFVSLNFYGKFKRGIATGANDFFLLNQSKILSLKLDSSDISVCLTKSQQINDSFFTENDLKILIEKDSPIFIFNPKDTNLQSSPVINYIHYGELKGYHNGYLTKNRKKWFLVEKKGIFPILFSVFSRGGYKVIRNYTNATNLTCFHGFEPNVFGTNYIDKIFIFLKSDLGNTILHQNRRKYGGDLDKFEPSDLNNISIPYPEQFDLITAEQVKDELINIKNTGKISSSMNLFFNNLVYKDD